MGTLRVRCSASRAELAEWLRGHADAGDVQTDGPDVSFAFSDDPAARRALLQEMIEAGFPIVEFAEQRQNLQELYLADTGGQ